MVIRIKKTLVASFKKFKKVFTLLCYPKIILL